MSYASTTVAGAIDLAEKTEKKASRFYLDSIKKIKDPVSKRILRHLADLEDKHIRSLKALRSCIQQSPGFFKESSTSVPAQDLTTDPVATKADREALISILNIIEDSENKAAEAFVQLAELVDDDKWKDEFLHLTAEEHLDTSILYDELFNVSNKKGVYRWGD